MPEASGVAVGTAILGLFTLSYSRFSFTNFAGDPGDRGEVSNGKPVPRLQHHMIVPLPRRLLPAAGYPSMLKRQRQVLPLCSKVCSPVIH